MLRRLALVALFDLSLRLSAAPAPALTGVASNLVAHEAGFWRACQKSADTLAARDVFAYAFLLGEARQHPERFDTLFALADRMQDTNSKSRTYGNFWWSLRDGKVMDANSVDFSMRTAVLLWMKDRDFLPDPARAHLEKLLTLGIQGCLHHHVATNYSNIAIMNAGDLILLGENLHRPEVTAEGVRRLGGVFHYAQTCGLHEFDSPTYTGVDLDGLGLIVNFARSETARAQARTLLNLWWTDIALNWFPPAQKLAGAQSRTYDYLHGLGGLDENLALNGWLAEAPAPAIDTLFTAECNAAPPADLAERARPFPRLVRSRWGETAAQARTHYLLPDITLSAAASSYGGRMDMPLTVDWAGPRDSVRGYFIADGRNDPYGKTRIDAGAHKKAFHLSFFWAGAQRTTDALGLAVYREKDVATNSTVLISDFVLPLPADSFWIGDQRVTFTAGHAARIPVPAGETVIVRQGRAALALRVVWSRDMQGQTAPVGLVYDGNEFGAVRLAVEHSTVTPVFTGTPAGAAFWLRVGDGFQTDDALAQWRKNFATAAAQVSVTGEAIHLSVPGTDGPVSLAAAAPWSEPQSLEPTPTASVLELNGQDIAQKILGY